MLPNVYGWSWSPGHVIFIGLFFLVALTVAATVLRAWWKARRDLSAGRADDIRWREDFHDLAADERACRHAITGELRDRECDLAFDCRSCTTHAKLSGEPPSADEEMFDRGHTVVRRNADGTFTVSLDPLAQSLLGPSAVLERPRPGTRVKLHAPAVVARRADHDVRIVSPLDGEVIDDGGALFRVRPIEDRPTLTHLLRGPEAEAWHVRELTRVQEMLSEPGAPSLADGGVPVADMPAAIPRADWSAVWGRVFLEP